MKFQPVRHMRRWRRPRASSASTWYLMAPTSRIASSAGRPGFAASGGARGDVPRPHARRRGGGDRLAGHRIRGNRPVSSERSNVGIGGTATRQQAAACCPQETAGEIDRWVAKFPPGRQRSASLAALARGAGAEPRLPHRGPHGRGGGVPGSAADPGVRGSRASIRCSRPIPAGGITSASVPTSPAC